MDRAERDALAEKRLLSVIGRHGAAIARTIEQKIADAGPLDQRIDPHILTPARNRLVQAGQLVVVKRHGRDWYTVAGTPQQRIDERIEQQFEVLQLTLNTSFTARIGEALEIAVQRALRGANALNSLGGFRGLTDQPTIGLLKKEEPPSIFRGREAANNKRFDFLVGTDIWAGLECKNIREWMYPDRNEVRHMLTKAVEMDLPPILVARRIPYVTRRLLAPAGVMLWETFNQLYPTEYDNLAAQMKAKESLGFFDIRVSDFPSPQLEDFIQRIIPEQLPECRQRFDHYKDLLAEFAYERMSYEEFAARIRRREGGQPEHADDGRLPR